MTHSDLKKHYRLVVFQCSTCVPSKPLSVIQILITGGLGNRNRRNNSNDKTQGHHTNKRPREMLCLFLF